MSGGATLSPPSRRAVVRVPAIRADGRSQRRELRLEPLPSRCHFIVNDTREIGTTAPPEFVGQRKLHNMWVAMKSRLAPCPREARLPSPPLPPPPAGRKVGDLFFRRPWDPRGTRHAETFKTTDFSLRRTPVSWSQQTPCGSSARRRPEVSSERRISRLESAPGIARHDRDHSRADFLAASSPRRESSVRETEAPYSSRF